MVGLTPAADAAATDRFVLDRTVSRPTPDVVLGGSPLAVVRLTPGGAAIVDAIAAGRPLPTHHSALTDRLRDAGVIHPVVSGHVDAADLTVVTPTLDTVPAFVARRCRWTIVDDGSDPPIDDAAIRHRRPLGPGPARNAALSTVATSYVAFVDADVEVDEDDLRRLAAHLAADPRCAVAAPRIVAADGTGTLARFERSQSPLDLGGEPARVAPTTRVSYVPAAVLVCRTAAVIGVGGFDPSLRYGEDVDLVWRLVAAGWRCRYEPTVIARHRTRPTSAAWLAQRFAYGTSAAALEARHPGALAPVRMSGWSWLAWAAGATLTVPGLVAGAAVTAGTSLVLARRLPAVDGRVAARLATRGTVFAGRLLAAAAWRAWWPATVAAAIVSRRGRRLAALAFLVELAAHRRTPGAPSGARPLSAPVFQALRVADDLAYGAGVWWGALRRRSLSCLLPRARRWPPRGDAGGR